MAYLRRLPSGRWQATVKHPSGRRFTCTDPLKSVVREWAATAELQIRRGDFVPPGAGRLTLAEWWPQWTQVRTFEVSTQAVNESHWRLYVEPAFGSWPIGVIQLGEVEKWVAELVRQGVGRPTVAAALRLLKQLLEGAVRHRLIRENPAVEARAPKAPGHVDRFLTLQEAIRLVNAVQRPDRTALAGSGDPVPLVPDEANQLFVLLMLEAGLRWQEVAGLQAFRVDLDRQVVTVQEVARRDGTLKSTPKSAAGLRVVPLTDEVAERMRKHLVRVSSRGLLFPAEGGRRVQDYANWRKRVWVLAVARAELRDPQPTPHDCRHSYGSWLADEGVPPHDIAKLMGHSSLRAVERYIHSSEERLARARQALAMRR